MKTTNIKDLRDRLLEDFESLRKKKLDNQAAKEITNMAGKIILSAKTELDFNKFMKLKKNIEFLNVSEDSQRSGNSKSRGRKIYRPVVSG